MSDTSSATGSEEADRGSLAPNRRLDITWSARAFSLASAIPCLMFALSAFYASQGFAEIAAAEFIKAATLALAAATSFVGIRRGIESATALEVATRGIIAAIASNLIARSTESDDLVVRVGLPLLGLLTVVFIETLTVAIEATAMAAIRSGSNLRLIDWRLQVQWGQLRRYALETNARRSGRRLPIWLSSATAIAAMALVAWLEGDDSKWSGLPTLLAGIGAYRLSGRWLWSNPAPAPELLKSDRRRPIYFARSFAVDDRRLVSGQHLALEWRYPLVEEVITQVLWDLGPVVTFENTRHSSSRPRASRHASDQDHWRKTAQDDIRDTSVIPFVLGHTQGLRDELHLVLAHGKLERTVFFTPSLLGPMGSLHLDEPWQPVIEAILNALEPNTEDSREAVCSLVRFLDDPANTESLICCWVGQDGSISSISSDHQGASSYRQATMIACAEVLDLPHTTDPSLTTGEIAQATSSLFRAG